MKLGKNIAVEGFGSIQALGTLRLAIEIILRSNLSYFAEIRHESLDHHKHIQEEQWSINHIML